MRLLVAMVALATFLGPAASGRDAETGRLDGAHWKLFKSRFNKVYSDPGEESMRMGMFLEKRRQVEHHNAHQAAKLGYRLGLNHMSDWTDEERARLNGFKLEAASVSNSMNEQPDFVTRMLEVDVAELPKEVDWRKVPGRVSGVKDQGGCGSCWAFSTTGVLEGQEYRFNNNSGHLIPLSEQNIVDCSHSVDNQGCNGGIMWTALADIAKEHGIESEHDYPYVNVNNVKSHSCSFQASKSVLTVKGSHYTLNGTEQELQKLVAQYGPMSTAMEATKQLVDYESGIFDDPSCQRDVKNLNHGVLVVGYGTDPKLGDYWLVKNSWSFLWGEEGYFRMARNKGDKCIISICQTIPIF